MFDYIESGKYVWEEGAVNVRDITLTGMGEILTPIIYGDEVKQNPLKFVEYIQRHKDDDRFRELSVRPVPENRQILILRETDGILKTLDGSHRLLSMIMNGTEQVKAYVAIPSSSDTKPMIGDAIFIRLREQWRGTDDPQFKDAIERTVIGMMRSTSNGRDSVKAYWVTMAPNEQIRSKGLELLKRA